MHDPGLLDHALFLVVGVLLPLQGLLVRDPGWGAEPLATREKLLVYWLNSAVLGVLSAALLWIWRRGGSSLAALGLALEARPGAPWWLLGAVALAFVADTAWKLTPRRRAETVARLRRQTPFLPASRRELAHSAAMVLGSGIFEELLYRGFAIAYLRALGAPPAAAVLVPAALFSLGHLYQGRDAALKVALLAGSFGWFYLESGVLWPLVLAHVAINAVGMLLSPWMLRAYPATAAGQGPAGPVA